MRPTVGGVLALTLVVAGATVPTAGTGGAEPVPERRVLLDMDRELVATVTVENQTHRVYRYENRLPYATGVEIYHDGDRVERARRAERVARALAWRRAAGRLDEGEFRELRRTRDRLETVNETVSPALGALNDVLGLRRALQRTEASGVSAWTAATTTTPSLAVLAQATIAIRNELRGWQRLAGRTDQHLGYVLPALVRLRDGRDVDHRRLDREMYAAAAGLGRLGHRSDNLSKRISTAADLSRSAAREGGDVPVAGDRIKETLSTVGDSLSRTATRIDRFGNRTRSGRATLVDVSRDATDERAATMAAWRSRQSARLRVYGSLGGIGALLVVCVGVFRRRRRIHTRTEALAESLPGARELVAVALDPPDPHAGGPPYCRRCGADLGPYEQPAFCPTCGRPLDEREPERADARVERRSGSMRAPNDRRPPVESARGGDSGDRPEPDQSDDGDS